MKLDTFHLFKLFIHGLNIVEQAVNRGGQSASKKVKTVPSTGTVMTIVFLGFLYCGGLRLPRKWKDHHWVVLHFTTGLIEGSFRLMSTLFSV